MNSRCHRYTSVELTITETVSGCTTQTTLVNQKNSQKSSYRESQAACPAQLPLQLVGLCGHSRCTSPLLCYSLPHRQPRGPPPLFLCWQLPVALLRTSHGPLLVNYVKMLVQIDPNISIVCDAHVCLLRFSYF